MAMKFEETSLPGVLTITSTVYCDSRGSFMETFNLRELTAAGLPLEWAQDNYSISKKNVLRGIHYQIRQPQGKLVRVTQGSVLDVAVDLRRNSPYFRKHVCVELSAESGRMLWIPPGFGHAFLVLSDVAGFAYKATDYYNPAGERTILWCDPTIDIQWPIKSEPTVSSKDAAGMLLQNAEVYGSLEHSLELN
jgi:dTDP-4-dehydrorhamnose 3,5-epimerase